MERKKKIKGYSPSGDQRGRNKSGHEKKAPEPGVFTFWRSQKEGQVRTQKETN